MFGSKASYIVTDDDLPLLREMFPYVDRLRREPMLGGCRLYGSERQIAPLRVAIEALDAARHAGWEAAIVMAYGSLEAFFAQLPEKYLGDG